MLGDGTAEIAHDALLQAWPRLRGWLEEDQSSLILYGQLAEDTARWRQDGKDSSRLYRGVQLAAAREAARVWAADPGRYPALPAAEAGFLRASGRASTRGRWGRRTLAGALVLLLLAALAGAGLAVRSARDDASRQRTEATSARLAGQSTAMGATDPVTASLLAAAAWRIAPTAQARYSLLESLAQPVRGILAARSGEVTAVASSPGGKTLAAAYRDGTIRLWDISSHRLVSSATWGGAADALAFTGGGKTLEVAGPTAVGVWNLAGRARFVRQPLAGRDRRDRRDRPVRRVQPRWHQAGHRRRRRERPAVGRGHPAGNRRADELRPRRRWRPWRSARTGRRWPRAAATERSSCGTRLPSTRWARRWRPARPRSGRSRSARAGRSLPPAARTETSGSGIPPRRPSRARRWRPGPRSRPCRSAATERRWPPRKATEAPSCGPPPPRSRPAPHWRRRVRPG